jgi:hypothetical protein
MTVLHGRFKLGQVVTTRGAMEAMKRLNVNPVELFLPHVRGDWGDLDEEDKKRMSSLSFDACGSCQHTRFVMRSFG